MEIWIERSVHMNKSRRAIVTISLAFIGYLVVRTIKSYVDGVLNFSFFVKEIFFPGLFFIVFFSVSYLFLS